MARYTGPVCRLCRKNSEKLFLKGERCYSSQCAIERRQGGPGQHGKMRRGSGSDFGKQLKEKQKLRTSYGCIKEGTLKKVFEKAVKEEGVTGTNMLRLLETRLDSIVYRLGMAFSRAHSRQLVIHGHILVNSKKVDKPGFQVKVGDVVEVSAGQKNNTLITSAMEAASSRIIPEWLELEKSSAKGTVKEFPTRELMPQNLHEQQVVELYSR